MPRMRQSDDTRQKLLSSLPFTGRELLLFGLLLLVYLLTAKGYLAVSDSGYSLRTARALVERGTFAIPVFPGDHGYIYQAPDGRAYAKYGVGLPLLWVPAVIAAKLIARAGFGSEAFLIDFLVSFYNIFFGAALAVVFYRIVLSLCGNPRPALRLALILGLATLCWRYSVWDFSEIIQAFFLLAAVAGLLANTRRSILSAGAAMAAMAAFKLFSLAYVPALAGYLVARNLGTGGRPLAAAVRFLLPLLLALLLLAGANWLRFGDPLESGYGGEVRQFRAKYFAGNFMHLLFLPAQGVFVYAPVLIMGVAAWPAFFLRHRREALLALALVLSNFLPLSFWHAVVGSWSWGPRWLVPVLPLWLLPLLIFLQQPCRCSSSWSASCRTSMNIIPCAPTRPRWCRAARCRPTLSAASSCLATSCAATTTAMPWRNSAWPAPPSSAPATPACITA